MRNKTFKFFFILILPLFADTDLAQLFQDLEKVRSIDKQIQETAPFIYNYSLIGGYFEMPSARVNNTGTAAIGGASVAPYNVWAVNFQMFSHIEFSGNYRVFRGVPEANFGHLGYGNDLDRTANVKFVLYKEGTGLQGLPSFALGFNDFYGSRRFNSFYINATKEWSNFEATFGWGKGRIHGFYGGIAWTPFRNKGVPYLDLFTLLAEYDANDYKHHDGESERGRSVSWPVNVGIMGNFLDCFQVKVGSIRGEEIAASGTLYYNIGETQGFFPKVDNPTLHTSPIDVEPLGVLRSEKEFAHELAFSLSGQGLDLYEAYVMGDEMWIKVINTMYREEWQIRERLQYLLSTLLPTNIQTIFVVIEADGIPTQAYEFSNEDLQKFRLGAIGEFELSILSPMIDVKPHPNEYEGTLIYKRKKEIWTFTVRPRLLTFFGSIRGKFKYSVGMVAGPEGYLFDSVYYKLQLAYNIKSSMSDVGDMDVYNPSQLLNVRSDLIKYYQTQSFSVEKAYIQKGFNMGAGLFGRVSAGYFEAAFAGIGGEILFYPLDCPFAIGFSAANIYKRKYKGLGFMLDVRKFNGDVPSYHHFIGYQYFLDLYYNYKPLQIDLEVNIGKFLARDFGARFLVTRYFPSGLEFSIWYTITTADDIVNRKRYDDKGVAFSIPFDFFLRKSSRTMLNYSMSAWLRDVGVVSETGHRLYQTIQSDRMNL
jgi:hypothetical protein